MESRDPQVRTSRRFRYHTETLYPGWSEKYELKENETVPKERDFRRSERSSGEAEKEEKSCSSQGSKSRVLSVFSAVLNLYNCP